MTIAKMKAYNPPMWNRHLTEVTLMDGEGYSAKVTIECGGNITALSVLQSAADSICDGDYEPIQTENNTKHIKLDDEGYPKAYILYNDNNDESYVDVEDIENYIIGINIVSYDIAD
ncbi:DUF5406 family protein (plasmid) [Paenibacillus sp. EC2-1]|uniref:DUF5406 family protein n=1 Tax=Paenibacillus sp. EC2-1 TaxID=3388665 RepID=UPI003BEF2521